MSEQRFLGVEQRRDTETAARTLAAKANELFRTAHPARQPTDQDPQHLGTRFTAYIAFVACLPAWLRQLPFWYLDRRSSPPVVLLAATSAHHST